MNRLFIQENIEVVVVSFGGVGTSLFMEAISKAKRINDAKDADGLKHISIPPISVPKELKYIYIYGDPMLAASSLFRRDYHVFQSSKLLEWSWDKKGLISQGTSIHDYAAKQIDGFRFERHFNNWRNRRCLSRPIMFLKLDAIGNNLDAIANFLEIPIESFSNYPRDYVRESSLDQFPKKTQEGLRSMYATFSERLKALPDYEIIYPDNHSYWSRLNLNYLRAFATEIRR